MRQEECASNVSTFEAHAFPHIAKLYHVAAWLLHDQDKAESLVQETLTQALGSFHQLANEPDACVWLIRIMYQIKNEPRRSWWRWHNPRPSGDSEATYDNVVAFEPRMPNDITEEEALSALRRLPPEFQEVILLSDVEELKYKETAEVMGVTVGLVMLRLARGRKMIRMELSEGVRKRAGTSGEKDVRASTFE